MVKAVALLLAGCAVACPRRNASMSGDRGCSDRPTPREATQAAPRIAIWRPKADLRIQQQDRGEDMKRCAVYELKRIFPIQIDMVDALALASSGCLLDSLGQVLDRARFQPFARAQHSRLKAGHQPLQPRQSTLVGGNCQGCTQRV